jgi:hypothetical protein
LFGFGDGFEEGGDLVVFAGEPPGGAEDEVLLEAFDDY